MIKKITMLILLILFSATISFGQMVSLGNNTAYANSASSVPINVTELNNINSFTFYINFDPEVLDFISISEPAVPGILANLTGSVINIVWFSTSVSSPSGVLCKLNFYYKGGTSQIVFNPGCEVTQGGNALLTGFQNGSIQQVPCSSGGPSAEIGSINCAMGETVPLNIQLSGMPVMGAFTQIIHYNAEKLTYVGTTVGGNLSGTVASVTAPGEITLAWSTNLPSGAGKNINTIPPSSNSLKLLFKRIFPGDAAVNYAPGNLFTTGYPLPENVQVCYTNGSVIQVATDDLASLEDMTGVIQGDEVHVPLQFSIDEPVSAFTLKINYSAPVLNFIGAELLTSLPSSASFIAASNGNTITIEYTNTDPSVLPTTPFLHLKFHYRGMGLGHVDFAANTEFADNLFQVMNVELNNATITPGASLNNAVVRIENVPAQYNSEVNVPVVIEGGDANPLGAATMYISYDAGKMSFIGAVDNIYNAMVNSVGNRINIAWEDAAGQNLNGTFLKLKFHYNGGAGTGCGTALDFVNNAATLEPCELADATANFVPALWESGGVNIEPQQPIINGPANPAAHSTQVYSTTGGMINYDWNVAGGSIVSVNGTSSITVTWGDSGAGAVNLFCNNTGGCNLYAVKNIMVLSGSPVTNISGFVTYDNPTAPGMNGVTLSLINSVGSQVGNPVSTTLNGSNGYYEFLNVPQDAYTLEVSYNAPWAGTPGVSALDALIVELQTVGLMNPPLTGIRNSAANVDGSVSCNATDALNIKRRIVGEINSFPVGNWVFNNGIIEAFNSANVAYNFKTLCSGDVNGSFQPTGNKQAMSVSVMSDEIMKVKVGDPFIYSIRNFRNVDLGAVTLELGFDRSNVQVLNVTSILNGFRYTVKDGKLMLAWSNAMGTNLSADEAVISFNLKINEPSNIPVDIFKVMNGSEFADANATVLNDMTVKLAKVITEAGNLSVNCYPNPIRTSANISLYLPEDGKVKYTLKNLVGEEVLVITDKPMSAGQHTLTLDVVRDNLTSGVYLGTLEYSTTSQTISRVNKILITK